MIFKNRYWKKGFPLILITALITQTFPMKVVKAEEAGSCICSCEQCSDNNEERNKILSEDPAETEGNEICACNGTDVYQGCIQCGERCSCCNMNEASENSVCNHKHDGDCGYAEAKPEVPCDMSCKDIDGNGIIEHCQECSYISAAEEKQCIHLHDENCGFYKSETEIQPEVMTEEIENIPELSTEQSLNDVEEVTEDERKTIEETSGNSNTDSEKETEAEKCFETEQSTEPKKDVQEADCTKEKSKESEKDSTQQQQETEVRDGVKTPKTEDEKVTTQESDSETEKGDGAYDIHSPYYFIKIPSEVMINESTDFEIGTSFIEDMKDKKAYLEIDGNWADDGTDCFVLMREGDEDTTWKYQLYIEGKLISKGDNRIELDQTKDSQKARIVSMDDKEIVPAGKYNGSLRFNVVYE